MTVNSITSLLLVQLSYPLEMSYNLAQSPNKRGFLEMGSHYVILASLELAVYTRLTLHA